jgi:hypothetical protein
MAAKAATGTTLAQRAAWYAVRGDKTKTARFIVWSQTKLYQ